MIPTVMLAVLVALAAAWWLWSVRAEDPATVVRPLERGSASERLRLRDARTGTEEVQLAPRRIMRPELVNEPAGDEDTDL